MVGPTRPGAIFRRTTGWNGVAAAGLAAAKPASAIKAGKPKRIVFFMFREIPFLGSVAKYYLSVIGTSKTVNHAVRFTGPGIELVQSI